MEERIYSIEESIFHFPLPLIDIQNFRIIESINEYLPYSVGIEIECDKSKDFDISNFEEISDIMSVQVDNSEQRFRIPNGLKGLICLYRICEQLKRNSLLNLGSGIHYHIDMTDIYHLLNEEIIEANSDWILNELDTWEYKGDYNFRYCNFSSSHHWMRFQSQFKTAEIRIGEQSFDYSVLAKRIIHANSIIRKLKDSLSLTKEEFRVRKLQEELKELQIKVTSEDVPQEEMKRIIKKRQIKLYE